jgi:riboflavin synthase
MFTGIIECKGEFISRKKNSTSAGLIIRPEKKFENPVIGESVSVNGCCLSLEKVHSDGSLEFFTLEETLKKTNLGLLAPRQSVNLERAMQPSGRMGGHIVSGHVDGTSEVLSFSKEGNDYVLKVRMIKELRPYFVPKGSIAINGVSLTLVELDNRCFGVHLIPLTLNDTILGTLQRGDIVNIETDVLGKYIYSMLSNYMKYNEQNSAVTIEKLLNAGLL